jgi:GNAT superfamily N-acetyltransferase
VSAATLDEATLATVRGHWAALLDGDPDTLREEAPTVQAWNGNGVQWLFPGDAGPVVAVPPEPELELVERIRQRAGALAGLETADGGAFERLLGRSVERVLGPQFVGYVDSGTFRAVDAADVRRLADTPADREALAAFHEACPEGSERASRFDAGCAVRFRDGRLVAAAAVGVEHGVAGVSVLVRPDCRGAGHGKAVVSTVVADALERGLVPEYRTLDAWPASVGLARSLGFRRYATSRLALLDG